MASSKEYLSFILEQLSALVKEYGALVAQGAYDYILEQGYVEALEQAIRDLIEEIEGQIDCLSLYEAGIRSKNVRTGA